MDGTTIKRQRLVLDCRERNQLFRPSPHTCLRSLATLAETELADGVNLYISGADIQEISMQFTSPPQCRNTSASLSI